MIKIVLAAMFALACVASTAKACVPTNDIMRPCAYQANFLAGVKSIRVKMHRVKRSAIQRPQQVREMASSEIVAHPTGCPVRLFCACGAAVRVFGAPIRSLWAAASWFKFPRTSPAPGMVAVRPHHVFVLEADLGNGRWRVYDANSGHGMTQIHARSIVGYAIVDPHAASL